MAFKYRLNILVQASVLQEDRRKGGGRRVRECVSRMERVVIEADFNGHTGE